LPTSPHFDFGLGLAPFARFGLVPQGEKIIELKAEPRPGWFLSDGTFHFPDVRVIFFDASGNTVPHLPPATLPFFDVTRLTTNVRVPDEAVEVVITTSPESLGTTGRAMRQFVPVLLMQPVPLLMKGSFGVESYLSAIWRGRGAGLWSRLCRAWQ
jgi:hypothetical protein